MGDLIGAPRGALALCLLCLSLAVAPIRVAAYTGSDAGGDTVIAVRRDQVLVGEGYSGRITVEAWARDRVELVEEGGGGTVTLRVVGNRLILGGAGARRRGTGAVRLRVPAWMPVQLRGGSLTATIEGLTAAVDLSSVEGDLALRNVAGDVSASSVEGSIMVERASGRLRLRSVEEGIHVSRVDAESVLVESTSGDVVLDGISAASVDVSTTEGDITFAGELRPGGSYRLSTHDGDLMVALPAEVSAVVTVSTFDGEFLPEVPITLDRFRAGKEMSFTLGRGGARLTLTAFDGDIVLRQR